MGRKSLLSSLEKRDLLNQSAVSIDKLLDWGALFESEGLINDAVDFFQRADSVEDLERLLAQVVEEGDTFLYGRILKALNREATSQDWAAIAARAEELGKQAYAREALKRAGLETEVAAEEALPTERQ